MRTGDFEDKISTLVKECQKMYISQPTETLQITYILKCWQHISNKQSKIGYQQFETFDPRIFLLLQLTLGVNIVLK